MFKYRLPSDTSTSADGCALRTWPWRRKYRCRTRTCTCIVGTFESNRNRSRNRIRVGNRKTASRHNPADSCTPARRWSPRIWCFGRKDWGNIVLLRCEIDITIYSNAIASLVITIVIAIEIAAIVKENRTLFAWAEMRSNFRGEAAKLLYINSN